MALTLVTPPATEPVTLTEAKLHLRVTTADDNNLITDLITAARQVVESHTQRALITQTYDLKLDGLCDEIVLPMPPLISVSSVTYTATDGVATVLATSQYTVDAPAGPFAEPGRIVPAYQVTYPTVRDVINSVVIRYVAGYGAASAVPGSLKAAVLLIIGHLYANRETVAITERGSQAMEIPLSARWLMEPFDARRFV